MPLRGLTPEQLFDSLAEAIYYPREGQNQNPQFAAFVVNDDSPREEFRTKFAHGSDRPTEVQTSILQALTLMNGKMIGDATSLERSELLAAVVDSPFMDTQERIETLYLATLTRKPKEKELARLVAYVDGGGAYADEKPSDGRRRNRSGISRPWPTCSGHCSTAANSTSIIETTGSPGDIHDQRSTSRICRGVNG